MRQHHGDLRLQASNLKNQMEKTTPGFVVHFDKLIKPWPILNNTFGVPADKANDPCIRIILPQAFKYRGCHDHITDPIGAEDQDGIGFFLFIG